MINKDYPNDDSSEEYDDATYSSKDSSKERNTIPSSPPKNRVQWRDERGTHNIELEEEVRSLQAATQKYPIYNI